MKKIIQYLILIILAALLSTGIIWAHHQEKMSVCSDVVVEILNADSTTFVTKSGIMKELSLLGIRIEGARFSDINTEAIEHGLERSEYLENVECVILNNNKLLIKATQMMPVMRIFDGNDSYYVNQRGKRMHATARYHMDVPVVEGHFTKDVSPTTLLPLVDFVNNDKMLSALVTMYSVRDTNNIFIVPCIYGHIINIGNTQNLKTKFEKLKKFYREVMPVKGWLAYDTISVKWDYQIVATRRTKSEKAEIVYNPEEDEQAPDLATIEVPGKPNANGEQSEKLKLRNDPGLPQEKISDPKTKETAPAGQKTAKAEEKKKEPAKKESEKKKDSSPKQGKESAKDTKKPSTATKSDKTADKVKKAFKSKP